MKLVADYHTHTIYSRGHLPFSTRHAKGTIEENVLAAIEKGLKTIGISDHGYKHFLFGMRKSDIRKIRREIDAMNKKYPEIEVLMGIECNVLDEYGTIDMNEELRPMFDYVNAGYHFGSETINASAAKLHKGNLLKNNGQEAMIRNTVALVRAMEKNDIFYITHPGDKGEVDILEVAKAAVENGVGLEINGGHGKLSVDDLKLIEYLKPDLYLGSDAHRPQAVGNVQKGMSIVTKSGIDLSLVKNIE